jgi:tetratricopeptide (TPR) repeat protein
MSFPPDRRPLLVRIRHATVRLFRRLAEWGAMIVAPFERVLTTVTRRLLAATEKFEGIDSLLIGFFFAVTWPARKLWRLLSAGAALLPESARAPFTAPFRLFRYLGRRIIVSFMRVAEALNLDGIVLRLIRWTRPVWYPLAAVLGFMSAWLATRSYKQLLWGLPVFVLLLPLAAIGGWTVLRGNESIAAQYRLAVKEAREKKDYERVQLYERKLAQLGVATELTDYQTALALAQDGEIEKAYDRMQRLAPLDKPGYLPAHYWIVQQLVTGTIQVPAAQRHQLIGTHLDHLQTEGVEGFEIDLMRAVQLLGQKKPQEAAELLKPHASRVPLAASMRMEINLSRGRLEEARGDARLVQLHMKDRKRRGEEFSTQDYAAWAVAERTLGDFATAHSLAEQWFAAEPGNNTARAVLLELSLRLFAASFDVPEPDVERQLKLFLQAAELADDPGLLQGQFASLYRLRSRHPAAGRAVEAIVNSPETPASILEAAGTAAATMGQPKEAKAFLKRAVEKDPRNSVAWNNYAWLVTQEPQGDLEDALQAVNNALEVSPDEFRFRETRGQVLLRLGRWQEAVKDLEFAANGMPGSTDVHLSLAKAYDALGEQQLARVHREHAERPVRNR